MRAASGHLKIEGLALAGTGPTLTLELVAGQMLGVLGPAGSGKTRWLRVLMGEDRAARGTVVLGGKLVASGLPPSLRRYTPQSWAKRAAGPSGGARASEAIAALGLLDVRHTPLSDLTPAHQAAAAVVPVFAAPAHVLFVDSALDGLDPWARRRALELLRQRTLAGGIIILATHLAELAPLCDTLLVLRDLAPVFAGSYADLERQYGLSELAVETTDHEGVRAIAAPFEIRVIQTHEHGLVLRAAEGQALAARLLTEGYGDIKAVVLKRPTPDELLARLLA